MLFILKDNLKNLDYIVVGQGLAGSAVALELLRRRRSFVVFDDPARNKCSNVAAGLFNPITGQNWVKTWNADILFPFMKTFYKQAELLTGSSFYYEKPIYRPFTSNLEQNDWAGKHSEDRFKDYICRFHTTPYMPDLVSNPFGGLELSFSGYLDVRTYMDAVRKVLIGSDSYVPYALY